MKLAYRNEKNAIATAAALGRPLETIGCFNVKAISENENEIYIYDYIGFPFNDAGELVRALAGMKGKPVTGRINSPGGDIFDAMAIFNAFSAHDAKVTMVIESMAASAASVIALAGREVRAYKNAMLMIHDPWVLAAGNQYELRETAEILEKISGNMVDIYAANSDVGKREARDMMKAETWMTAKEAKDKGFVDTIIDGKGAKAQFDLSIFAHAPDLGDGEPTIRKAEKALRDAGFSAKEAKAMLSRRGTAPPNDQRDVDGVAAAIRAFTTTLTA